MARLYTSSEDYLAKQGRTHAKTSRLAFWVWVGVTVIVLFLSVRFLISVWSINFRILWVLVIGFTYFYISYRLLGDYSVNEKASIRYRLGREGELNVLEVLKQLDDNHSVFYGGRIFRGNIDFAVLRGNTLFNIEVKNHAGNITFNGRQLLRDGQSFAEHGLIGQVIDSERQLRTAFSFLPDLQNIRIVSVLVFANSRAYVEAPGLVNGVHVTHRRLLANFIKSESVSLRAPLL